MENKIKLMYFTASWCGPCRMMKPILDNFIDKNSDKISLTKIDIDSDRQTAINFQINSVPTFLVFKNGNLTNRFNGMVSQNILQQILN
jgi:thioredoxin 1